MLHAGCEQLIKKPGKYLDKSIILLFNKIVTLVNESSIRTALESINQTKKEICEIVRERNIVLCIFYLYTLSAIVIATLQRQIRMVLFREDSRPDKV